MKYKIAKKAYEIDFSRIEEGYSYAQFITYADNRNKAKSKLLEKAYSQDICLIGESEEVTYINIPIIRCKGADKLHFEGKEMTLWEIEKKIKETEHNNELEEILNNKDIKYCYIIKRGCYYRPNSCGYTDYINRAGVYTKHEAVKSAKNCIDIKLMIVDIESHNKMIQEEINDLKTQILLN